MQHHLHILCDDSREELVAEVLRHQTSRKDLKVVRVDLDVETPDYSQMLEEIFRADTVTVW